MKEDKFIPYNRKLKGRAREMRNNPTVSEKRFWCEVLKNKKFHNYKFLRQKVLLNYIVDFYCSELLLVIEVDGETHVHSQEYDQRRENELEKYGIKILRYENNDIFVAIEGILDDLLDNVLERVEYLGITSRVLKESD